MLAKCIQAVEQVGCWKLPGVASVVSRLARHMAALPAVAEHAESNQCPSPALDACSSQQATPQQQQGKDADADLAEQGAPQLRGGEVKAHISGPQQPAPAQTQAAAGSRRWQLPSMEEVTARLKEQHGSGCSSSGEQLSGADNGLDWRDVLDMAHASTEHLRQLPSGMLTDTFR